MPRSLSMAPMAARYTWLPDHSSAEPWDTFSAQKAVPEMFQLLATSRPDAQNREREKECESDGMQAESMLQKR